MWNLAHFPQAGDPLPGASLITSQSVLCEHFLQEPWPAPPLPLQGKRIWFLSLCSPSGWGGRGESLPSVRVWGVLLPPGGIGGGEVTPIAVSGSPEFPNHCPPLWVDSGQGGLLPLLPDPGVHACAPRTER